MRFNFFSDLIRFSFFSGVLVFALVLPDSSVAANKLLQKAEEERHAQRWEQLKSTLFPDREVFEAGDLLTVDAPVIPLDPSVVSVSIRSGIRQSADRYIKTISLLVNHNPAPMAAVFHLTPRGGEAHLKTRVRVNEWSDVTAVAETSDGQLYVARKFVKASGGCDAPPRVDSQTVMKGLGDMKLKLPGGATLGQSSPADLSIQHPNYNGMQVGNTAGVYIPPKLVQKVEINFADESLLVIDGHMSLSEDPRFRFYYQPDRAGDFTVKVVDSDKSSFEQSWTVDIAEPPESADSKKISNTDANI